ncbi:MAG: DUF167 family protein [Elusimicrobiales bacterium]
MRYIRLKVHAGAKTARLERRGPDALEAWVKSPAERGLANAEALNAAARELGIEAKRLRIIKGAHSPAKILGLL